MWSAIGLALSCIVLVSAIVKSKRPGASYYASEVYGMTVRTHRAYAAVSMVLAVLFVASFFVAALPVVPLLAANALVVIFYFSSFARGFSDEE